MVINWPLIPIPPILKEVSVSRTLFGLVIQLACGFFVLLFPREARLRQSLVDLKSRTDVEAEPAENM
jgi:hypothetical protein